MYISRLKNSSLYRISLNNLLYIAFSIILLILSINYIYLSVLYILYIIYIYKNSKELLKVIVYVNIIFIILYLIQNYLFSLKELNEFTGYITKIDYKDTYQKVEISNFFQKVIVYDKTFTNLEISNKVKVTGNFLTVTGKVNEFGFDTLRYYQSKRIVSVISSDRFETYNSINIFTLRKYIYKYLDYFFENDLSSNYIKAFIFGDTSSVDDAVSESIKINSISHLFAISGMHITIIISFLEKIFKNNNKIISLILFIYLIINNFLVSILRACLMYYLKLLNEKYDLKLSSLDILSICFIFILFLNPFYIYNVSFILSFIASFSIILYSQTIKINNNILNTICLTLFIQIISMPFVCNMSNIYNLISPIVNVIFIFLVTYIILPLSFITLFIPIFSFIFNYILNTFEYINVFISKMAINISIPSLNVIHAIILYILIYLIFKYKNKIIYIISILFVVTFYFKSSLNIVGKISFLCLKEGDAIVIDMPLNKGIIVIDTGIENDNALVNHLRASGIRKIDALVLTHNHSDHNGKAYTILEEFNVKNVIVSTYDNSRYKNLSNVIKVKKGDMFTVGDVTFEVLNPDTNETVNDNSIVLHTKLGTLSYLFLGDITENIEKQITKQVDVVKIAHHGSKTSTCKEFVNNSKMKYAIITSGYLRKHGFPDDETIENLQNVETYRTDISGDINIYYCKLFSIFKTIR